MPIKSYLNPAGKKTGEIIGAGFDPAPMTLEGIKEGYIDVTLDQQQYLQGYLPLIHVCLSKKYGLSGLYINTGGSLVDAYNVDYVIELAEKGIR